MNRLAIAFFACLPTLSAAAEGLRYDSYDVLFTNPTCREYRYDEAVKSIAGRKIVAKPKDVYCTSADMAASAARPESPQYKLIEWIRDPNTTEIFFSALSFSNRAIERELCDAIEQRNMKLTFVLDSGTGLSAGESLMKCKPADGESFPKMELRGNNGGIGFAHNKLFLINPHSDKMKIAFGSGNVSSGTAIHHENWHFIALDSDTYFAQSHLCLRDGMLEHHSTKKEFSTFMKECRSQIEAKEEDDLKAYFVPGDGAAAFKVMDAHIKSADQVLIAAHRFSYNKMIDSLTKRLANGGEVKLVADDDIFWAGHHIAPFGANTFDEYKRVTGLTDVGMQVKFMETNGTQNLFHHNKFMIFNHADASESAVFAGAGNFTGSAFNDNFENFYVIQIPSIVEKFNAQYTHLWKDLATAPDDLPEGNPTP